MNTIPNLTVRIIILCSIGRSYGLRLDNAPVFSNFDMKVKVCTHLNS